MRRLVVHGGFHKTGTTSLQKTLKLNARLLVDHVEVHVQENLWMVPLAEAVLEFSLARNPETKARIRSEARALFATFDLDDPRPILISSEHLAGHMIGVGSVQRYVAGPIAMEILRDVWRERAGAEAPFDLYYSTRREGWIASCHWQRLKFKRCLLNLEDFAARYPLASDFDTILDMARARLGAESVHAMALDDMSHPIDPVLDLLELTHLRPVITLRHRVNAYPGGNAREALLELNRSDLHGAPYIAARDAIISPAQHIPKP
ncbi:hypothetical protein [Celeribacter ethanolicus]|uniref:hypothetical protein n=1 Tax=Celeribacter ethanolicus TaxID=1758178 RepID=UPI000836F004|nr:hypothetical protein [Celeribacter ethanolicus]TNE69839.1 MAG: hypothetical protein EP336_01110 [Paracoccaceae bacterium]